MSLKILNANPYFGISLTEQETKDILTSGTLILHLGTVDQNGHANIHPVIMTLLQISCTFKPENSQRNHIILETMK
ncbi:MAG: hypothetical protein ACJ71E_00705 [Nitrososphaeraceae archaeon]